MPEKITIQVGTNPIHIETGRLAKQADGSVTVQLGETIVIVAAVAATEAKPGQDFFPLTVDYREKAAAAGKFPGGYFKREGRPTEKEILTSRVIDAIGLSSPKAGTARSRFKASFSARTARMIGRSQCLGASALMLMTFRGWSDWCPRVGRVAGRFAANPTHAEMENSDPTSSCRNRDRPLDV